MKLSVQQGIVAHVFDSENVRLVSYEELPSNRIRLTVHLDGCGAPLKLEGGEEVKALWFALAQGAKGAHDLEGKT